MKSILIILFIIFFSGSSFSQIELTNANDEVYDFLKRMQVQEIIPDYNSSNLPLSRYEISNYLLKINSVRNTLNKNDRSILDFYLRQYNFDITGNMKSDISLVNNFSGENLFSNDKYNHIYAYSDSNASLFFDITGGSKFRKSNGDSLGDKAISFMGIGFQVRGSLFNSVGYYLKAVNWLKTSGDSSDIRFARLTDPEIFADWKLGEKNENYYTPFEGYLRYQTKTNWLALTAGRTPLRQGFGYIDKLYLSDNTVAFDFFKLDLNYKALQYSFTYGGLRGDSAGIPGNQLDAKNISTHRLTINFSNRFKLGIFESVVIPNSPFNFTFFNPISFLTAAELNKSSQGKNDNANNSIMGFDLEAIPVKNLSFQISVLLDDFSMSGIFKSDDITNKFGYQAGIFYNDAFTVPGLVATTEYTRINPFVYTHEDNLAQYTHWNLPLGHLLQPNSDEIAAGLNYYFDSRFNVSALIRIQRHAAGRIDSAGSTILNYGGNINDGQYIVSERVGFLNGNRINKNIYEFNMNWEPLLQWKLSFKYVYALTDKLYINKKIIDRYFFINLGLTI